MSSRPSSERSAPRTADEGATGIARLRTALDHPIEIPWWLPALIVSAAVIVIVLTMRIDLALTSTTPTNGDLGGHVWGPWQLRSHVLPSLSAWSPEWYGGFPVYLAYPVLPALAISLLSVILPYGVAIKVIVVLGCASVPVAAWGMGRLGRFPEPAPSLMALLSLAALLDNSSLYGANLQSALIGEYSEGLAIPLALVGLGLLDRSLRSGRDRWLTALVLALAALCHPVSALVLIVGAILLLVLHGRLEGTASVRRALPILAVACGLCAFWFIPFLAYRGQLGHGAPFTVAPLLGTYLASLPLWAELILVPCGVVGALAAVLRRSALGITLAGLTLLAMLSSIALTHLAAGSVEAQRTASWLAGRLLPLYELGLVLLAGLGLGALASVAARSWRPAASVLAGGATIVTIGALGITAGWMPGSSLTPSLGTSSAVADNSWLGLVHVQTSSNATTARISLGGYEQMATWPQYRAIIDEARRVTHDHGCGRFLTEADVRGSYGSVFEFALLPYWTDGCASTISGGNPIEDSWTGTLADQAQAALSGLSGHIESVPYPPQDEHAGVTALRSLGVRYLMVFTPSVVEAARADHRLTEVGTAGAWHVFVVSRASLVMALRRVPYVVPTATAQSFARWNDVAARWMFAGRGPRPAADGPASWPRAAHPVATSALPRTRVTHVETSRTSISFDVTRLGVPVVINASFFPWWRLAGAEGPWRIAPNAMVVLPTSHHVVATVGPRAIDALGRAVSAVGLIGLGGLVVVDRRRRRHAARAATVDPAP